MAELALPPATGAVFVDPSGRRGRLLTVLCSLVVLPLLAFLASLATSLVATAGAAAPSVPASHGVVSLDVVGPTVWVPATPPASPH